MKSLTTNTALDGFMQAVILTDAQRRGARVTNERDFMDMRESRERSECCWARVNHDGLHTYCDVCGNPCNIR